MDARIFVSRRPRYEQEAKNLERAIHTELGIDVGALKKYVVYDVHHIDEVTLEAAKQSVFSEVMIDEVFDTVDLEEGRYFSYEFLPAQYDQRADSAMQAIRLLNEKCEAEVRTGVLLTFEKPLTADELEAIRQYLVNPIESREKNIRTMEWDVTSDVKLLRDLSGFTSLTKQGLEELKKDMSLSLGIPDLEFIQAYFREEQRDPTETEVYVLDCYWSDHCRHTTFETVLDEISIESALFEKEMQDAFDTYVKLRHELGYEDRPMTLMDMASIIGKYHVRVLHNEHIEVSDEINACSFFTTILNQGKEEKWLIQFKNETHNHPSEIEPFGGASTCVGGAIRDPLSGRSYVYQAMRVSGSGDILKKREETLPNKLPQSVISKGTAHGNSSYGNQIGLATTFVRELYDDSYVAKHMEVGAVVGAVKVGDYKREKPEAGDMVLLIGGRTGRDGIQGASGSSVEHTSESLETMGSQVQKGNAPEERKLQRLFRNRDVTNRIKKCNDFGAGGVCVAIGELAEGIEIYLHRVPVKYRGLNATELAISESQERMAVVVAPEDKEIFAKACELENVECTHVATITNRRRLEMYYGDEIVVNMGADFLATAGVRQHATARLVDNKGKNPFAHVPVTKEEILKELASYNVTCQKGMAQQFDASIGVSTVLMPFAGVHQLTPVQAGVQAIPTLHSTSDTATALAYGFIPKISHYSPFLSAIYAVLESVAKIYAVGGSKEELYFSFQEYFEKLGIAPDKWGKVTQALLGALHAQAEIGRPSIGGKDSMSGTFNDLNVVETLISFACAPVKIQDVITPELKRPGNTLYYVPVVRDEKGFPQIRETIAQYDAVHELMKEGKIDSVYVQETGSIVASLVKMGMGSGLTFDVQREHILDFDVASMVLESSYELPFEKIGTVTDHVFKVNGVELSYNEVYKAYTDTFRGIYPLYENEEAGPVEVIQESGSNRYSYGEYVDHVRVVIPVFPGTNCEYDTARAFLQVGAEPHIVVIRNHTERMLLDSINEFVAAVKDSHIIAFPGGFSSGDEPDGSAKFIVNFLKNSSVKEAIHNHLQDKKLILGICNGFQALIKSGLIPYGEIRDLGETDLTLYRNDSYAHISRTAFTRVANTNSPWTQELTLGDVDEIVFSHGEGRLVGIDVEKWKHLAAFQYCDTEGVPTMNGKYNPNGSELAIEGMMSENGLVLGKMGHSERYYDGLYKTNTIRKQQEIFRSGVNYFKGGR